MKAHPADAYVTPRTLTLAASVVVNARRAARMCRDTFPAQALANRRAALRWEAAIRRLADALIAELNKGAQ